MYYYDPNDRRPRRWATVAAAAYALLLTFAFAFVSFDFTRTAELGEEIEIEFVEPVPEPPRPVRAPSEPRVHDRAAAEEQTAQVEGRDEQTRTPNPRALFKMDRSGADEPDNAGNPHVREGEEQTRGTGPGLAADGLDQLDKGLQGRGLAGALPRPAYPGAKSGKVVIRVTVGPKGDVTGASFEPRGSTTEASELVAAAIAAARKARFTESAAPVQGGTITYIFRME